MNLNIDGGTLAQAMSEVISDLYTHPTGAPAANGVERFTVNSRAPDMDDELHNINTSINRVAEHVRAEITRGR
jgi:hypothetical protein